MHRGLGKGVWGIVPDSPAWLQVMLDALLCYGGLTDGSSGQLFSQTNWGEALVHMIDIVTRRSSQLALNQSDNLPVKQQLYTPCLTHRESDD